MVVPTSLHKRWFMALGLIGGLLFSLHASRSLQLVLPRMEDCSSAIPSTATNPTTAKVKTRDHSVQPPTRESCYDRPTVTVENRDKLYEYIYQCANLEPTHSFDSIAEVGVWKGGNARTLYNTLKPDHMTLVDPWFETDDERYKASNEDLVRSLFESETRENRVTVIKSTSTDWFAKLENNTLDLLYLDTVHSYIQTFAELELIDRVLNDHAFLCGHDFGHPSNGMEYGVMEATVDFALKNQYQLLAVSKDDPYRSFCMGRSKHQTKHYV